MQARPTYCGIPRRVHVSETIVSIYRKFEAMRLPSKDVYARTGAPGKRPADSVGSPQAPNHELRRKGAPANVPLPRTLKWVEGLPSSVKPAALLRHYARIANVLAAAWDDPTAVSSYMECLFGVRARATAKASHLTSLTSC